MNTTNYWPLVFGMIIVAILAVAAHQLRLWHERRALAASSTAEPDHVVLTRQYLADAQYKLGEAQIKLEEFQASVSMFKQRIVRLQEEIEPKVAA